MEDSYRLSIIGVIGVEVFDFLCRLRLLETAIECEYNSVIRVVSTYLNACDSASPFKAFSCTSPGSCKFLSLFSKDSSGRVVSS